MKHYKVIIEPEARHNLQDIYDFISINYTKIKAIRFLQKLQESINSLAFIPEFCYAIKDENTRDMVANGYIICYHVHGDHVHVVAIFKQKTTI